MPDWCPIMHKPQPETLETSFAVLHGKDKQFLKVIVDFLIRFFYWLYATLPPSSRR